MNSFSVAATSIAAPFKRWRLFLRALVPMLLIFALAIASPYVLPRPMPDRPDMAGPVMEILFCIGFSLFDWHWLSLLRAPQSSWRDRLRGQWLALLAFTAISWALFSLFLLLGPLQSYAESFDPIAGQMGDKVYYATSFRTAGIAVLAVVLLSWLRLRLLLWPVDILVKGRLTSPIAAWQMTRGKLGRLIAMFATITAGCAAIGGICAGIGYLFFGGAGYGFGLPAVLLYWAALDHAYLHYHSALQPIDRAASMIANTAQ